jgi:hypothetical protein
LPLARTVSTRSRPRYPALARSRWRPLPRPRTSLLRPSRRKHFSLFPAKKAPVAEHAPEPASEAKQPQPSQHDDALAEKEKEAAAQKKGRFHFKPATKKAEPEPTPPAPTAAAPAAEAATPTAEGPGFFDSISHTIENFVASFTPRPADAAAAPAPEPASKEADKEADKVAEEAQKAASRNCIKPHSSKKAPAMVEVGGAAPEPAGAA